MKPPPSKPFMLDHFGQFGYSYRFWVGVSPSRNLEWKQLLGPACRKSLPLGESCAGPCPGVFLAGCHLRFCHLNKKTEKNIKELSTPPQKNNSLKRENHLNQTILFGFHDDFGVRSSSYLVFGGSSSYKDLSFRLLCCMCFPKSF